MVLAEEIGNGEQRVLLLVLLILVQLLRAAVARRRVGIDLTGLQTSQLLLRKMMLLLLLLVMMLLGGHERGVIIVRHRVGSSRLVEDLRHGGRVVQEQHIEVLLQVLVRLRLRHHRLR